MHIKPMKPFFSNMFRMVSPLSSRAHTVGYQQARGLFGQGKTLDVITLFHGPKIAASNRVLTLLKQGSASAAETATEDQASDHSPQNRSRPARETFELDITEAAPTEDQLTSILEYLGNAKIGDLVEGASSVSDAAKKLASDSNAFKRPIVVDWSNGKAIVGEDEAALKKMVHEGA